MAGSFIGAWILFPLVLLVASLGCGLLVRRLGGGGLEALLVLPVGFALVVVICAFACSYEWLAPAAGGLVAAFTVVGLVLEARTGPWRLPRPRLGAWLWPLLAALVAFAAVGGPVFITGKVGWTGYTRIVDIAFQFDFAQHLADAGRTNPAHGDSSYNIVVTKLIGIGYPGGAQATLGAMANFTRTNVAWCYQSFLAYTAAMGALAIFSLLGRATRNGLMRFIGAAVGIQPNVLYGYALEAGIKELTTTSLLFTVVAVFAQRLPGDGPRRATVPAAVAVSGAFAAFSLGIAPWLGVVLLGVLIASLAKAGVGRRRAVIESWGVFAIVAIVISLPGLVTAAKLANVAGAAVGGVVNLGLGNLAAPVSRWASAGVWLTGDYRYPLAHTSVEPYLRRSHHRPCGPGSAGSDPAPALGDRGPRGDNPGGAVLLRRTQHRLDPVQVVHGDGRVHGHARVHRRRVPAGEPARLAERGGVGGRAGSGGGGAVRQRADLSRHALAPGTRYHDLAAIAKRYAGQGPTLDPYFDEYAEYFLRSEKGSTIVDPANFNFQVRPGVAPEGMSFGWDLNQLVPAFLQSFPLIVQPTSPTASRAPSNYDLIERSPYFEVWKRARPSSTVLFHAPLSSLPHERTPAFCAKLVAQARKAGPGAQIAYAKTSVAAVANPLAGVHSSYWHPLGPSTLLAYGAGSAHTKVTLPGSGRYSVWVQGSVGRPVSFYLDGRRLASVSYEERYPAEFLYVSSGTFSAGVHTLSIVRGGGSLHPGSGNPGSETGPATIGAIVFEHQHPNQDSVYVAPAARTAQICAAPVGYEWLELLRPAELRPTPSPRATDGRRAPWLALLAAPLAPPTRSPASVPVPASSCRRRRIAAPVATGERVRSMSRAACSPRRAACARSS